jgi:polynucleotide 5'-kinase involved in rRNA processing
MSTDVGQNEVYMPAFEALARVELPLVPGKVRSSELLSCFVGSFSPPRALTRYISCFLRLLRRARGWTVVDTDGWVEPWSGVESKAMMAEESGGSVVVVGDRGLHSMVERLGVKALFIPRVVENRKSPEERRRNRLRMLSSELAGAPQRAISLSRVVAIGFPIFNCEPAEEVARASSRILYAERCGDRVTVVVRGRVEVPLRARFLRDGWERNVLIALSHGDLRERAGLLVRISYRSRMLTVVTRDEEEPKAVIMGEEKLSLSQT